MGDHLLQLGELTVIAKTLQPTFEFELVKDFLENSAQTPIYLQSCRISTELCATTLQQLVLIKQTFDTLIQYGAVARYHPRYAHDQHRIAKYAEWCRYLAEHPSVQDCRDIVTQFQTTVGKNSLSKVPLQQVMTFSYQLQTIIGEGQYRLQSSLEKLNAELDHDDVATRVLQLSHAHEETKIDIRRCLGETPVAREALETISLNRLAGLNAELLTMEQSVASATDNLVELSINGKWFLEELLAQSTLIFDICRINDLSDGINQIGSTISMNPKLDTPIRGLQHIRNLYVHLCFMNESFFNITLGDILHGIIGEDKSVLSMISAVSSLQEGLLPVPELLTNLNLHLRRNASSPMPTSNALLSGESTTAQAVADAKTLMGRLKDMKDSCENSGAVTKGQALFLAFNGMFDTLDVCHQQVIDHIQLFNVPEQWRGVDHMKNAMELAVSLLTIKLLCNRLR